MAQSAVLHMIGASNGEPVLLVKERLVGLSKQSQVGCSLSFPQPRPRLLQPFLPYVVCLPEAHGMVEQDCYAVKPVPVT